MRRFLLSSLSIAGVSAAVAACGGGAGGGGGVTPAAPSPASTPMPLQAVVTGRVFDCLWSNAPTTGVILCGQGSPIGGATVVIGPAVVAGATPPAVLPGTDVETTTAADGTFSFSNAPAGTAYAMVFPPTGNPHAPFHVRLGNVYNGAAVYPIPVAGSAVTYAIPLSVPTAVELTWLNAACGSSGVCGMNADRATSAAPPLVLDELLLEALRNWTIVQANTPFGGDPPNPYVSKVASTPGDLLGIRGGQYGGQGRIIETGGPVLNASPLDGEANFETEALTQPAGPHWQAIVTPGYAWVGLSRAQCALNGNGCQTSDYIYGALLAPAQ